MGKTLNYTPYSYFNGCIFREGYRRHGISFEYLLNVLTFSSHSILWHFNLLLLYTSIVLHKHLFILMQYGKLCSNICTVLLITTKKILLTWFYLQTTCNLKQYPLTHQLNKFKRLKLQCGLL